jgi:hypothetical protein
MPQKCLSSPKSWQKSLKKKLVRQRETALLCCKTSVS